MSEVLSSIGSIFSKGVAPASVGLGEIGNLLASHAATSQLNKLNAAEAPAITGAQTAQESIPGLNAQLQKLIATSPADLAREASTTAGPISQALEQTVNNQVQGDMASRGLAQAPGVFAAGEAQALAPYEANNFNTALNSVTSKLGTDEATIQSQIQQALQQAGLPAEYAYAIQGLIPKGQSLSPAMLMAIQQLGKSKGGGSPTAMKFPTTGAATPPFNPLPDPSSGISADPGLGGLDMNALGVAA